jgi:hypothetical protein
MSQIFLLNENSRRERELFLVPEFREENGSFIWFPKVVNEKVSGTLFTRISGTAEK